MKKTISTALIICMLLVLSCCGAASSNQKLSFGEDWLMNTYCLITIYDAHKEQLISDAFSYARDLEKLLSRTVTTSDVYRFNESEDGIECAPETAELVNIAKEYYELSGGLFDITVGKVSKLWDFAAENPKVPDAAEIADAVLFTQSADNVRVEGSRLVKDDPDIEIDLGGIAKGYIADKTKTYLVEAGVSSAVINFGGNVVLIGSKPDGSDWRIGIEQPFSGEDDKLIQERSIVGTIDTSGGAVVTSGTYERKFRDENGVLYHHVLDPRSGYPAATDLDSATVIGPDSARCDALSTSCLLLGSEGAAALISSNEGYSCVLIRSDGTIIPHLANFSAKYCSTSAAQR